MDAKHRLWVRACPDVIWESELGQGALFNPATGETHFLSELPALILSVVDDVPASFLVLVERLAGSVDLDGRAQAQIVAALVYLEAAELVESLSPKTE